MNKRAINESREPMDKEKNKALFDANSSWKYFLIALVVITIAYFIGTAFFKIFPSMETHF